MHILVNKRYMWRLDTCAGHEALIIKLLVKKPPGIMRADSTSVACERCASRPFKAWMRRVEKKKGWEKEQNPGQLIKIKIKIKQRDRGRKGTRSPVLGVESS